MKKQELNKSELIAKRDELRARLQSIQEDYKRGLDADSEERASQLANAEVLEGISRATLEELERIEGLLAAMN